MLVPALDAEARQWPDGKGGLVDADLVMIRGNDVVLRPDRSSEKLIVLPDTHLRDMDHRYLQRHFGNLYTERQRFEDLPEPLASIAGVGDAATLVHAASCFRGKTKEEVLGVFQRYLDAGYEDNLWLIAPVIFEQSETDPGFSDGWPQVTKIIQGQPILLDTGREYAHSGPAWPDINALLEWIKTSGRVRKRWLAPELMPTQLVNQCDELTDARHRARRQAWLLVRHLFDLEWQLVFQDTIADFWWPQPTDEQWQRLKDERWKKPHELCVSMDVTWDPRTQTFQRGNDTPLPRPPADWMPQKCVRYAWWGEAEQRPR